MDEVFRHAFQDDGSRIAEGYRIEVYGRRGALRHVYTDLQLSPWLDRAGKVVGVVAEATDAGHESAARRIATGNGRAIGRRHQQTMRTIVTMQDCLLPAALPVLPGLQTAGSYVLAADEATAGGDWLDVVAAPDGLVYLVVGDVVGHGAGAVAMMGRMRAVLNDRLGNGEGILAGLHALDRCAAQSAEGRAATVAVVELDPGTGRFTYCTAGHPPPLLVSSTATRYLAPTRAQPLATGGVFHLLTDQLGDAEVLIMYSDGLVDARGRDWTEAAVQLGRVATEAVRESEHGDGFVVDRVCATALEALSDGRVQSDDVAILSAQRVAPAQSWRVAVEATPEQLSSLRHGLDEWVDQFDASIVDTMAMRHAAAEATANVVVHAYQARSEGPRPLWIDARLDPNGDMVVTVTDDGEWRRGGDRPGGRGVSMMHGLVDHAFVDHADRGTRVVLRHALSRAVQMTTGRAVLPLRPPPSLFQASIDGSVLTVCGPIDEASAPEFEARMLEVSSGRHAEVSIDLSEVTVLSSAGVGALFDLLRRTMGRTVEVCVIAAPGTPAHHVCDLVGIVVHTRDR